MALVAILAEVLALSCSELEVSKLGCLRYFLVEANTAREALWTLSYSLCVVDLE